MNKNLTAAIVCIALIAAITLLSALPIGFSRIEETAPTISTDLIAPIREETQGGFGNSPGPVVHRVTFVNTWLPRQVTLPRPSACLYNSKTHQGAYANARWQISTLESRVNDFGSGESVVQLGRGTRTVELTIDQFVRWKRQVPASQTQPQKPMPAPGATVPVMDYPEGFDTLYLFLIDRNQPDFYPDCSNLQTADLAYAKKITVV